MEITLPQLMKVLRKNLFIILFCTIVVGAAAFGISKYVLQKTYVSSVKFYVDTASSYNSSISENINGLNYAQKLVNTYIEMLDTNSFLEKVEKESGVDLPLEEFKKTVKFSTLNDTEVFEASVSAHTPDEARNTANVIENLTPSIISQFKTGATLKIVDPASYPDKPATPNVTLYTVTGLLLGFILAGAVFVLRDSLDVRIKNEDDITEKYNLPILACVPEFSNKSSSSKRHYKKDKNRGMRK
jgi:succinoglycan biosynthesis transport protein ExoP